MEIDVECQQRMERRKVGCIGGKITAGGWRGN